MNTDRFREQTMPVYRNPALESRWNVPPGGIFEGTAGEGPIGLKLPAKAPRRLKGGADG